MEKEGRWLREERRIEKRKGKEKDNEVIKETQKMKRNKAEYRLLNKTLKYNKINDYEKGSYKITGISTTTTTTTTILSLLLVYQMSYLVPFHSAARKTARHTAWSSLLCQANHPRISQLIR
jgi:hypothetical protein